MICLIRLTQHSHQNFIDPGKDSNDVERREGNVEKETHSNLNAFLIANVPETNKKKFVYKFVVIKNFVFGLLFDRLLMPSSLQIFL
jgi:hypothetical protein